LRAVRANVERMSAVNPDSGVLIIAQEKAPTGTLVQVVDEVHLGGSTTSRSARRNERAGRG